MAFPPAPEDRPDPNENMPAVRARVPENVARGEISTGVIVVTGATEYVLDFVRNLPRPNTIVARVVLPHMVMPQFIEALNTNIDLFRQRYGELPGSPMASPHVDPATSVSAPHPTPATNNPADGNASSSSNASNMSDLFGSHTTADPAPPAGVGAANTPPPASMNSDSSPSAHSAANAQQSSATPGNPNPPSAKRQNPQEIYDELKIRDEILSGSYANAVMIGHGPYEFSFDFITNFYPQSAVSCRVYLAAGHIWRLLDSLRQSWDQLRPRLGIPPNPPNKPPQS